jgi:hypothetical protein
MAGSNFQTSPPHLTNHMYVLLYTGISGTRAFSLSILWCSESGDHPEDDLARLGDKKIWK